MRKPSTTRDKLEITFSERGESTNIFPLLSKVSKLLEDESSFDQLIINKKDLTKRLLVAIDQDIILKLKVNDT